MLPHAPSSLPRYGASADPRPVHPSPVIDSTAPPRSSLEVEGSREVGTNLAPRPTAMATMGMLTRKIEPHEKWLSRSPPQTGPRAMATPATAVHRPIALARSLGSVNTLVRIDSVAGMTRAAPTPMTARAAMSWLEVE